MNWLRLMPLWLGLWLLASFGGPSAAGRYFDGIFCQQFRVFSASQVVELCCDDENPVTTRAALNVTTPDDDCDKCCAPISHHTPESIAFSASHAAILSVPAAFKPVFYCETTLFRSFASRRSDALPRPPPRGRAPPFLVSISPL